MEFQDKPLTCKDCGKEFIFTSGEQTFYQEKGLKNVPTRCKDCRINSKRDRMTQKKYHEVECVACGQIAKVPFKPVQGKPVYCRDCFNKNK